MIIYNVTVKIDLAIHDEWLDWMKTEHIPEVMRSGYFTEYSFLRLLEHDESDGITYAVQYHCPSLEQLFAYERDAAPALRQKHEDRYKNRFVAFRSTLMKQQ